MAKKKPTFEEALKKLESIATQIEDGRIGLEDSIAKYEEGMALVKQCRDILSQAEMKIQKLHEKADGTLGRREMEAPESDSETNNQQG